MEEQLSGSCVIEIAAFNEFSNFITDGKIQQEYDHSCFRVFLRKYIIGIRVNMNSMAKAITNHICKLEGQGQAI
jgi:hypothetical protein